MQGALFLVLLAVQFGLQPVLFREFSPRNLNKKSIVLVSVPTSSASHAPSHIFMSLAQIYALEPYHAPSCRQTLHRYVFESNFSHIQFVLHERNASHPTDIGIISTSISTSAVRDYVRHPRFVSQGGNDQVCDVRRDAFGVGAVVPGSRWMVARGCRESSGCSGARVHRAEHLYSDCLRQPGRVSLLFWVHRMCLTGGIESKTRMHMHTLTHTRSHTLIN